MFFRYNVFGETFPEAEDQAISALIKKARCTFTEVLIMEAVVSGNKDPKMKEAAKEAVNSHIKNLKAAELVFSDLHPSICSFAKKCVQKVRIV